MRYISHSYFLHTRTLYSLKTCGKLLYNSNMSKCRRYEKSKIINIILENHFEKFKEKKLNRIKRKEMRDHIINVVKKALNCGNIEHVYIKYKCLTCYEEYVYGFSCKSKFCTKCGRMYSIKWSEKQADNMLNVKHRHAVFTIPEELRNYFYKKRELLKALQDETYGVISHYYKEKIKGEHEVGLIAVVHTFGADLKWNPHVHTLFTEGGIDKNNKWFKKLSHIPYKYLRKSWQKLVLDIIKSNFKDRQTQKLINSLYKKYNDGFYVNAQRDLTKIKEAAKYIGRYLSRPAIAEYRISEYDGINVTFWYENKNPKEKITVKMDALDFIGKLVNHIHPKGFRVVMRYGLYSRIKNKLSIEIVKLYNFMKQRNIFEIIQKQKNKKISFKERLIETFGVNPFICTNCGKEMLLWEIWHHKYGLMYNVLDKTNYRNIVNDLEYVEKVKIEIYESEQLYLF